MSEISGPELDIITQETSGNDLIDQTRTYQILHQHIVDANKETLEDFLKKVVVFDINDWFFCAYKATFKGSNYISRTCTNPKCKKVFMDSVDMDKMVEYGDEESKNRMTAIISGDTTSKPIYSAKLIPIGNKMVVGIKIPTMYKIIFEQRMISEDFRKNNSNLMELIAYIDDIYYVSEETKMLYSIDTKPDENDHVLTVKRRISTFGKAIMTLNSDEYSYLVDQINKYYRSVDELRKNIKYKYPATECPRCHTKIDEEVVAPMNMLFLRHRLGRLLNTFES